MKEASCKNSEKEQIWCQGQTDMVSGLLGKPESAYDL